MAISDPVEYRKRYNPFVPYAKLVFGVVAVGLSLTWILHIIVAMLPTPPFHPFLNK
jgi:hypothetical protein